MPTPGVSKIADGGSLYVTCYNNVRSTVERANSHLKDWLVSSYIHFKRIEKMLFILTCCVLFLVTINILQHIVAPALLKSA